MDKKAVFLIILVVILASSLACFLAQRGGQQSLSPGTYARSMSFGGRDRTYNLHIPPAYNGQNLMPLVIALHGGAGNANDLADKIGMTAKADNAGFIVVYPNGTGNTDGIFTWNAGYCCGYALQNNVDDVGFIRALIEELQGTLKIDPKRMYVTGMSNGGMMAYRLGTELSDKIAAIAPVAGSIGGKTTASSSLYTISAPSHPVSVIAFHGKQDQSVLYEGGQTQGTLGGTRVDMSVAESISFWVQHDGCSTTPQTETSHDGNIIKDTYTGGQDNTEVVLYTIVDGGHAWPGASGSGGGIAPTQDISATDLMWDFFVQHPKE